MTNATPYDVVIIGGGPGGSTAASLLRKYNPALRVLILEKARFPRDHVGESQLPAIGSILNEMGVWEKVEQAGFPIKIGASYTWGRNNDRWDFDFYPVEEWRDEPRPAMYTGQRLHTAFQVDRALYDDLLLKHAESLGAEARQETHVVEILREGDRVTGLRLECGEIVTGRHYIDASGTVGILRRAMGVEVRVTNELRNIAVWEYWRNAEWAVEIGVGATRVQVRSLPYGWIWFIPLGPDRTSVGLITPAEHYKKTGLSPEEIYLKALEEQPEIASLVRNATRENNLQSCKDWSQLAERVVGENWFLVGEAAGFADPILAAGMSLAHSSAREAAYTILELDRAELDPAWLRERYDRRNRTNIEQHIRFAQYCTPPTAASPTCRTTAPTSPRKPVSSSSPGRRGAGSARAGSRRSSSACPPSAPSTSPPPNRSSPALRRTPARPRASTPAATTSSSSTSEAPRRATSGSSRTGGSP